jgi:hypothetical protein
MTERRLLKIGPRAPFETRGVCWVALADRDDHMQLSGDYLITRECLSLRELEAEITQMKHELDEILREAQKRFPF